MRIVRGNKQPAFKVAGATVKALRELRGWSQADLSGYATKHSKEGDVSTKTISNIETGRHKTTLGKATAIANAFDVEVWQLFIPLPEGLEEGAVAIYFRDQARLVNYFRQATEDGRASILRNARLEAETKLSEAV